MRPTLHKILFLTEGERARVLAFVLVGACSAGLGFLAVLHLDDINIKKEITFIIYPKRPEDSFHLLLDPNGEMIAVDAPRVANILKRKDDFRGTE